MNRMKEPWLEPILRWMRIKRVLNYIPRTSIVLDVGCGQSAAFLKAISHRIKQGFGVDMKAKACQVSNIKILHLGWFLLFSLILFLGITYGLHSESKIKLLTYWKANRIATISISVTWLILLFLTLLPYLKIQSVD